MKAFHCLCLRVVLVIGVVNASLDFIGNSPEGVNFPLTKSPIELHARQDPWQLTCGFKSDNPSEPRIAASGWYCATDKTFNYWGFCPMTITAVSACPIARLCQDVHSCSAGCGRQGWSSTYSCATKGADYCVEDLLVASATTYRYFSCGSAYKSDVFFDPANAVTDSDSPATPSTVSLTTRVVVPAISSSPQHTSTDISLNASPTPPNIPSGSEPSQAILTVTTTGTSAPTQSQGGPSCYSPSVSRILGSLVFLLLAHG